jgi:hypothetical protein
MRRRAGRVAARVGEGLLDGAHQREGDLGRQLARGALDDELAAAALLAVRLDEPGERLRQRWGVAA